MKILITGASGFIGSFLVDEALDRGYEVWAGIRPSSSRKYLNRQGLHFAELDYSNRDLLCEQLREHREMHGVWDCIIHAAGVTKCLNPADFEVTNYGGTVNFVEALRSEQMLPKRFVYLSSLSVFGAIREEKVSTNAPWNYMPILESDTPKPNTAYGCSKLKAEHYLRQQEDLPWVILRPTGVYGPKEKDYFLMAQSIAQHSDFAVGFKPQEITFVYVRDVVQAAFLACEKKEALHRCYFLSDGEVYHSSAFSDLLQKELGGPWVLRITAPLWLLYVICVLGTWFSHLTGKITALNTDKYHILKQRNWQCDITPARQELGYEPKYKLAEGVKEAVAWYKKEGWL